MDVLIQYVCGVGIRCMGRGIRSGGGSLLLDGWWGCNILNVIDRCILWIMVEVGVVNGGILLFVYRSFFC